MTNVEKLLKDLISIPSSSGEEIKVAEFIFGILKKQGFQMEKIPVSGGRFNVVAKVGKPKVYFSAHMDTVPPFIPYSENSEFIFGRGSCDTKGSIAAMITAALEAKQQNISNFGLIFTVGEEVTFDGALAVVKSGLQIPFVVIGEPTSLDIVNAHFGILVIKLTAEGKAAHSSRPELGINAIDILLKAIEQVKTVKVYPETLMSLVQINGGIADNIIPAEAQAIYSFRIAPNDTTDYYKIFKSFCPKEIKLTEEKIGAIACEIPPQLDFIKNAKSVKYLTELSFFKNGIVLGPGDIQYAHGTDEKIPKKELAEAVEVYKKILENFSLHS